MLTGKNVYIFGWHRAHVSIFPPTSLMHYCSQDYDSSEKFHIKDDRISHLLPACYQDMIVRVYTRKPELVSEIQRQLPLFSFKLPVSLNLELKKKKIYEHCIMLL